MVRRGFGWGVQVQREAKGWGLSMDQMREIYKERMEQEKLR